MSTDTRRSYLAAAIHAAGHPITTETAVQLLEDSPWATGRNTVRKGLRSLARSGVLVATDVAGRRVYVLNSPKGSA